MSIIRNQKKLSFVFLYVGSINPRNVRIPARTVEWLITPNQFIFYVKWNLLSYLTSEVTDKYFTMITVITHFIYLITVWHVLMVRRISTFKLMEWSLQSNNQTLWVLKHYSTSKNEESLFHDVLELGNKWLYMRKK